jgi:putative folate metabolism gamma-glutamate ligase
MKSTAYQTPIFHTGDDLFEVLKQSLPKLSEKSVVAVTSKIISLAEKRVVPVDSADRDALVEVEAEYYLPREYNKYGFCLSINHSTLIASAGIDESNGEGNFILWPKDPQKSANEIREFLCKHFGLKYVGVVVTDSHVLPFRWGTHGTAIAHSGFNALNNYIGTPDIFGRTLKVSRANISEGLAATAVMMMGEGAEQTPICVLEDVPFVDFQARNPTQKELDFLRISPEDDVYAPIFQKADWKKGKKK